MFKYILLGKNTEEVIFLFNSICERRMQSLGMYAVILQMPAREYFNVYDTINEFAANELVKNYLNYRGDDGIPDGVKINYNTNDELISINLYLNYTGNKHSEIYKVPELLNKIETGNNLT